MNRDGSHVLLLDEKGRVRAGLLREAVSSANVHPIVFLTRLAVRCRYSSLGEQYTVVCDGDTELFRVVNSLSEDQWDSFEIARTIAEDWLKKRFPNWEDPNAYWNDELTLVGGSED